MALTIELLTYDINGYYISKQYFFSIREEGEQNKYRFSTQKKHGLGYVINRISNSYFSKARRIYFKPTRSINLLLNQHSFDIFYVLFK